MTIGPLQLLVLGSPHPTSTVASRSGDAVARAGGTHPVAGPPTRAGIAAEQRQEVTFVPAFPALCLVVIAVNILIFAITVHGGELKDSGY